MSSKLDNDFLNGELKWFHRGIKAIAVISTAFTLFGALGVFDAQTFTDMTLAAALALASGIMIVLVWRILFESAKFEITIAERLASLVKTLMGAMAITAASTWFMVAGFAQNTVDKIQMLQGVAIVERYTAEVYEQAVAVGHLAPQIADLSTELSRWSKLERKEGVSTGISGPGAVVSALAETAENLGRLGDTITAAVAEIEGFRQVARDRAASMRASATASVPASARWQSFGVHEAAWRTAVSRIEAGQLLRGVVANLEAASRDLGAVVVLSRNKAVAAKQQGALAKYRALVDQRAAPIIAQARELMTATRAEPPVVERIGVAIAVLKYWQNYAVFWVLGLGLDFAAPLIMLISIHVKTATTTPRDRFIARVLDTTVADQAATKMARQMLKRIDLDQHSGDLINNAFIGRNPDAERKQELTHASAANPAQRGRIAPTWLAIIVIAGVAALIVAATVFIAGRSGQELPMPPVQMPSPSTVQPEPSSPEPGCTRMPNGILVCTPDAPGLTGADELRPGAGSSGTHAARQKSCVAESFPPRPEAVAIVDAIVATVGVVRNFEVREGRLFHRACIAVAGWDGDTRHITYDRDHFRWHDNRVNWSEAGIMAHELGHLLMSHWMDGGSRPPTELESDYFSGFSLARMGGTLAQALAWTALVSESGGETHPPRAERIRAVARGWGAAIIQATALTGKNVWLGEEFVAAGQTCRLARVADRDHRGVRIACKRDGRWFWSD